MTRQAVLVHRLALFASGEFLAFIFWIIYLADTGQSNMLIALSKSVPYGDKIGHLLIFGPFTFGINAALHFRKVRLGRMNFYLGTLLVVCFVLTEEFSQYFFPRRTVELLDLLADGAGIALFTWLSHLLEQKIRWRNSVSPLHLPVSP